MPNHEVKPEISILDEAIPIPTAEEIRNKSKKKKKRKTVLIVGIILLVMALAGAGIASLVLSNKNKNDNPMPTVESAAIYKGDFEQQVTASGTLEPISSVLVNSELGGTVTSLSVVEGQQVKKGDVLFTSRNNEVSDMAKAASASLTAASQAVSNAVQAQSDAERSLSQAKTDLKAAEKAEDRAKASKDAAAIEEAKMLVASAKQAVEAAQMTVTAAKGEVSRTKLERENASSELGKINRQLEAGKVVAPIDGTIIAVNIKEGSQLGMGMSGEAPNTPAANAAIEIADLTRLVMRTAVSEEEVVLIKNGSEAKVTFAALPGLEAVAKVVRVAPRATGATPGTDPNMPYMEGQAPQTEIKFSVDVEIENPDPRLKYGMSAEVSILVTSIKGVLLAPKSALIQDGAKFFVEQVDPEGNSLGTLEVKVLASNDDLAALEGSKLEEGMLVSSFPMIDSPSSPDMSPEEIEKLKAEEAGAVTVEVGVPEGDAK